MKTLSAAGLALSLLASPSLALAQPAPVDAAPAPAASRCDAGAHPGVGDVDAATASRLVCTEILRAGGAPARYVVSLGKLGSSVVLSVAREGAAPGSIADSRELRLQGVEDVTGAASRIADSVVHGTPLAPTEPVAAGPVGPVGDEPEEPKPASSETHFALGLVALAPPLGHGLVPSPGFEIDVHQETASRRFELGGSVRLGAGSSQDDSNAATNLYLAVSLGAKGYLADADVSAYLGGGLAWSAYQVTVPPSGSDFGFEGSGTGFGVYVETGVEVLRTRHTHISFGPRLDLPFYSLNNGANYYYVPVSLEVRLTL